MAAIQCTARCWLSVYPFRTFSTWLSRVYVTSGLSPWKVLWRADELRDKKEGNLQTRCNAHSAGIPTRIFRKYKIYKSSAEWVAEVSCFVHEPTVLSWSSLTQSKYNLYRKINMLREMRWFCHCCCGSSLCFVFKKFPSITLVFFSFVLFYSPYFFFYMFNISASMA